MSKLKGNIFTIYKLIKYGHRVHSSIFFSGAKSTKYNYGNALGLSILFFDAQRSGKMPASNPIPWRHDSAMNDHGDGGVDLTGGWYDGRCKKENERHCTRMLRFIALHRPNLITAILSDG